MLAAFIRVEVGADVDDANREGCQRILVDTLAGAPVDLGQHPINSCDNGMLGAFSRDVVTSYAVDRTVEAGQDVLMDTLAGAPVGLGQRTGAEPDNDVLRPFRGDIITSGTSQSAIPAELRQNILCNFGEGGRIRCSRTASDINGKTDGWGELCDMDLTILLGHGVVTRNIDRNGKRL